MTRDAGSFNLKKQTTMKQNKNNIHEIVTEQIIAQLEAGTVPWRKPWRAENGGNPANFITRRPYRGINWFLLNFAPYSSPYWLTFNQADAAGGCVRKGEKGTQVVFWNWVDSKTEKRADGSPKKIPFLKYFTVFNVEQCDGLAVDESPVDTLPEFNPIEAAEKIVTEMPKAPRIHHGGGRAFYHPSEDSVTMPPRESFDAGGNYYSVLFHELTHATGHESRLNRAGITELAAFGDACYAKEELVAEMGAAFLSAASGIENTIETSAAYIAAWLKALKNDSKLVVQAAAQAQRAADFIMGTQFNNESAD